VRAAISTAAEDRNSSDLVDLDGRPFNFGQSAKGSVSVAIFTRSDCPISNRYAPDVRELYEKFHSRGVAFYLIYVDPGEQPEAIRRHVNEYDYPCTALRDPNHVLVAQTKATVTPEAALFDIGGNIVYRGRINDLYADLGKARAAATKHDLRDALEATLAGEKVAEPVTKAIGCYIADLK
jgi:hypothetical protein